jgi:GxxExxY protein
MTRQNLTAESAEKWRAAESLKENDVSSAVIGAAIDVHKELGPGLVEKIYEEALCHELHLRGLRFLRQRSVPISYKGVNLSVPLWLDLLIEEMVIIDLKAKEQVTGLDKAQLRSYLRLTGIHLGLIINFHVERLVDGITRVVNKLSEFPADDPPDLHS